MGPDPLRLWDLPVCPAREGWKVSPQNACPPDPVNMTIFRKRVCRCSEGSPDKVALDQGGSRSKDKCPYKKRDTGVMWPPPQGVLPLVAHPFSTYQAGAPPPRLGASVACPGHLCPELCELQA